MYELIQVGENTFYIDCPVRMGIYRLPGDEVILMDSGGDKDAGKKVIKVLESQGWKLSCVLVTHSNADHIGGLKLLQDRLNVPIYAKGIERAFTEFPALEPSFLYGGYPHKKLRNKFLMAEGTTVADMSQAKLPEGFRLLELPGHFFHMVGFRTPDDVVFLADAVFSEDVLNKYHMAFLYDVAEALNTLDKIEAMEASLFVPCHAAPAKSIASLVEANRRSILNNKEIVLELMGDGSGFDAILAALFDRFGLVMDFNQNVLVGSTVKSYISCLLDEGRAEAFIEENMIKFRALH